MGTKKAHGFVLIHALGGLYSVLREFGSLQKGKNTFFTSAKSLVKISTVETAKPPIKSGVSWAISFSLPFDGAGKRTWTSTELPRLEPESSASANSAIPANVCSLLISQRRNINEKTTKNLNEDNHYLHFHPNNFLYFQLHKSVEYRTEKNTESIRNLGIGINGARNGTWTRMVFTTRPSNVRVCQFRHSRISEISAYIL